MPAPTSPRQELLDRQQELWDRVEGFRHDWTAGLDADPEEPPIQQENQEELNALLQEALAELQEIENRLRRDEK